MPTSRSYVTSPSAPSGVYKVDGRATYNFPLKPISVDVHGGPHVAGVSGVHVGSDDFENDTAPSGY